MVLAPLKYGILSAAEASPASEVSVPLVSCWSSRLAAPAHRAMTLMLYTGAAKCDAVKLGRGNIRDGRIVYRRRKTKKNPEGFEVNIPVHPYLAETLAHIAASAFTFLRTRDGKARSPDGLGTSMRKWCDKAGLPLCTSHGLHKAICRRIAEVEGDVFKVMAVSGHTDIKEAQKYCERFNRMGKADSAIAGLPGGAESEQNLTNHPLTHETGDNDSKWLGIWVTHDSPCPTRPPPSPPSA